MGARKGKAKEAVGWATGDRGVEAKGRVEQHAANPLDDTEEVTDEAVAEEKLAVRDEHGDHDPDK